MFLGCSKGPVKDKSRTFWKLTDQVEECEAWLIWLMCEIYKPVLAKLGAHRFLPGINQCSRQTTSALGFVQLPLLRFLLCCLWGSCEVWTRCSCALCPACFSHRTYGSICLSWHGLGQQVSNVHRVSWSRRFEHRKYRYQTVQDNSNFHVRSWGFPRHFASTKQWLLDLPSVFADWFCWLLVFMGLTCLTVATFARETAITFGVYCLRLITADPAVIVQRIGLDRQRGGWAIGKVGT